MGRAVVDQGAVAYPREGARSPNPSEDHRRTHGERRVAQSTTASSERTCRLEPDRILMKGLMTTPHHFATQVAARGAVIVAAMVAVLGAVPGCAAAPSPWAHALHDTTHGLQDPLLDRFAGTWVLEGRMAGGEVVHDIVAEWVTGHQYLRFVELSREREDDGTRAYEALVIIGWDAPNERYACLWLDSTGGGGLTNGILGFARSDPDRLAFVFDFDGQGSFHTTFAYDRQRDAWEWRMDSEDDGQLVPFTRATMTRRD